MSRIHVVSSHASQRQHAANPFIKPENTLLSILWLLSRWHTDVAIRSLLRIDTLRRPQIPKMVLVTCSPCTRSLVETSSIQKPSWNILSLCGGITSLALLNPWAGDRRTPLQERVDPAPCNRGIPVGYLTLLVPRPIHHHSCSPTFSKHNLLIPQEHQHLAT